MSFNKYTDASLILVPSGYKAGVLYSQVPTDGDGDMTVVRASEKTRQNSSGNLAQIADNVPALDYALSSCPACSLDPATLNACTYSEDFSSDWSTIAGSSVSTDAATSPDGTANADELTFGAGASSGLNQTISISTSTEYTMSIWAKVASSTENFRMAYYDGASQTTSSDFTATTDWQRFTFTFTTAGSHTPSVRIVNKTGGGAGPILIWGAQVEVGGYATGYVPTDSGTKARSADAISLGSLIANSIIGASTGTMVIDGKINGESGNANLFRINDGTVSNQIRILTAGIQAATGGVTDTVAGIFTTDAEGYFDGVIGIRWNGTNIRVYVDGTAIGNANFTAGASLTTFELNGKNTTSWIRQVRFYNSALSDPNMVTATS